MLNLMKADFYRIFRGMTVYITMALCLIIELVNALHNDVIIGVNVNATVGSYEGTLAPFKALQTADNFIYFILPIIFVVIASDFSDGAIKNCLSCGVSRVKFYFAKLLTAFIISAGMFALTILATLLCVVVYGLGAQVDGAYLLSVLRPFAAELVMMLAIVCIGTAIIFITKKGAALNAVYLGVFLGVSLVAMIFADTFEQLEFLLDYDFTSNMKLLSMIGTADTQDIARPFPIGSVDTQGIVRAFSIGAACIFASTALGVAVFRKSEIK